VAHRTKQTSRIPFSISGNGAEVQTVELIAKDLATGGQAKRSGKLTYVCLCQITGGTATAGDLYIGHRGVDMDTPSAVRRPDIVMKAEAIVITADAVESFFETGFDFDPDFVDNMLLAMDVTAAAGAWTIDGYVEVEF
jgi:hypothetical protein